MPLIEVPLGAQPMDRFAPFLGRNTLEDVRKLAGEMRRLLSGRVIWNVNSTARGGGVAEMLRAVLPYARGLGIDTRWLVIDGTPEFFHVTKRIHYALHGSPGDGTPLDDHARAVYEQVLHNNAEELLPLIRPRDFVILHDPQAAGLAPHLAHSGASVIWRCHIGSDQPDGEVAQAWDFLSPYLAYVHANVFSRYQYIPAICDHGRSVVIPPSIDIFSAKNQDLDEDTVRSILVYTGLVEGPPGEGQPIFQREDGSPGRVDRHADVVRAGRAPTWDTPMVVQVSRWDPLKDPAGVIRGFAQLVDGSAPADAELVLAGPNVKAIADDPEQGVVLDQVMAAWRKLPHGKRNRIHLASLPMADVEENAAIVNALQRHAAVVVQKSLHEGFGLTVTEAMWKARPVAASAVGGIQDQIIDGETGLLLEDPADLEAFGNAVKHVLEDPAFGRRLGENARERVRSQYLGVRHLIQYASLLERLD